MRRLRRTSRRTSTRSTTRPPTTSSSRAARRGTSTRSTPPASTPAAGPMTSANVTFYSDAGGLPGSQVATRPNLSVVDSAGSIMIAIPSAVTLGSGHYWVSVQANMDFNVGGQWYFEDRTVQSNAERPGRTQAAASVSAHVGRPQQHVRDRPRCARSDLPPERHHRRWRPELFRRADHDQRRPVRQRRIRRRVSCPG